jgi:hypothetical protein
MTAGTGTNDALVQINATTVNHVSLLNGALASAVQFANASGMVPP